MKTLTFIFSRREYKFNAFDPWECGDWEWGDYDADAVADAINDDLEKLAWRLLRERTGDTTPGELVDDDILDAIRNAIAERENDLAIEFCEGDTTNINWDDCKCDDINVTHDDNDNNNDDYD